MSRLQTEMEELGKAWIGKRRALFKFNGRNGKESEIGLKDRITKVIEENGGARETIKDCFLWCRTKENISSYLIANNQVIFRVIAVVGVIISICVSTMNGGEDLQWLLSLKPCIIFVSLLAFLGVSIFFMAEECRENRRAAFYRCAAELLEDRLKEEKGNVL